MMIYIQYKYSFEGAIDRLDISVYLASSPLTCYGDRMVPIPTVQLEDI
jgi:hypothetical protein